MRQVRMSILRIDSTCSYGYLQPVACILTKSTLKAEYRTIKTTGQSMHDLFLEIDPDIVLLEVGASASREVLACRK